MLLKVPWDRVYQHTDIDEKVKTLDNMIAEMVEISFPIVKVRVNNQDLPYITAELKTLARSKKKEHKRMADQENIRR